MLLKERAVSNMDNKQYDKVVDEGLGFDKAMQALLDGKRISRFSWGGYWEIRDTEFGHLIIAVLKNGDTAVATPYQEDMLAFDWQVVE